MEGFSTILLSRTQVADLLTLEDCIPAVESAFALYAKGQTQPPTIMGMDGTGGGFHIKAGILNLSRSYFVAKINANFPLNPKRLGKPSIQGVIVVMDANDGALLALIDSIEITIIRTGAATGVATKWLATMKSDTCTICGCGNQGDISLRAIRTVRPIRTVFAYDIDISQSEKICKKFGSELTMKPITKTELKKALTHSQIVVTCTPSREPFISSDDISPGTFIAAVGADSEDKREIFPELMLSSKIVADIKQQSASIGEFHHLIKEGRASTHEIYGDLGSIIAGKLPGRQSDQEIILFDSTGTALQDVAAAAIVYERAIAKNVGTRLDFGADRIGELAVSH